jgi:hypothetical protein
VCFEERRRKTKNEADKIRTRPEPIYHTPRTGIKLPVSNMLKSDQKKEQIAVNRCNGFSRGIDSTLA